jgi:hypothetical protein
MHEPVFSPITVSRSRLDCLGMGSLVLGAVGLMLFFMPVLGLPVSAAGFVIGLVGWCVATFLGKGSLRWSVAGVALCLASGGASLAIGRAPVDYMFQRPPVELARPTIPRLYVPPPARPQSDGPPTPPDAQAARQQE